MSKVRLFSFPSMEQQRQGYERVNTSSLSEPECKEPIEYNLKDGLIEARRLSKTSGETTYITATFQREKYHIWTKKGIKTLLEKEEH